MSLQKLRKILLDLRTSKEIEIISNDYKEEINNALKYIESNNADVESKVKNYEAKISKLLAYSILTYRLSKLYEFLESNIINATYSNLLSNLDNKIRKRQAEKMKMLHIQTNEDIPPIYADDGFFYGPLKNGDIVFISESFSSILLKKKLAKEIV
jgi:hypothetical protein